MKTKCDGGYGSLLLCRRKDQAPINSVARLTLIKLFGSGWRLYDKGEKMLHACQREVREEVNLDLPLGRKIEQLMTVSTPAVIHGAGQ